LHDSRLVVAFRSANSLKFAARTCVAASFASEYSAVPGPAAPRPPNPAHLPPSCCPSCGAVLCGTLSIPAAAQRPPPHPLHKNSCYCSCWREAERAICWQAWHSTSTSGLRNSLWAQKPETLTSTGSHIRHIVPGFRRSVLSRNGAPRPRLHSSAARRPCHTRPGACLKVTLVHPTTRCTHDERLALAG